MGGGAGKSPGGLGGAGVGGGGRCPVVGAAWTPTPAAAALVGDSFTDIEAAKRAGVASIGYANRPGQRERMIQMHAGAMLMSMADLALLLRAHSLPI